MKKIILLAFSALFLVGCSGLNGVNSTKGSSEPVPVTLSLIESVNKGGSQGLSDMRFHFQEEFVLVLADIPGNGIRKVDDKTGEIILLNDVSIRFTPDRLGKFVKVSQKEMLESGGKIEVTFERLNSQDPTHSDLGEARFPFMYDKEGNMRIRSNATFKGKPALKYLKAIYVLPDNYIDFVIEVGETKKGRTRIVSGVLTPAEESQEQ